MCNCVIVFFILGLCPLASSGAWQLHKRNMGKASPAAQPSASPAPLGPGRAIAKVKHVTQKDILGQHKNRKQFREKMTYAFRHMKEIQKREGIVRASKPTSPAIYYESIVPTSCDLVWLTTCLVQRSGKSIVKAWHLENVRKWQQGLAPLDPELAKLPKIPRKWLKQYEATH